MAALSNGVCRPHPLPKMAALSCGVFCTKPHKRHRSHLKDSSFVVVKPKWCCLRKNTRLYSKWAERLLGDFQFVPSETQESSSSSSSNASNTATLSFGSSPLPERTVELPIDFYKVLGAETHFLADGIRRGYEAKASKLPQSGFSQESIIGRKRILQAACETLTNSRSRAEYNEGLVEDEKSNSIVEVPWEKVPGALPLLQESGENEFVIEFGRGLLLERLPKSFKQDVVLAMSLAYVDLSRDSMVFSPPDFIGSCEMLERALKLLQEEGASNLAPGLQSQIDETLEEITPRCVLDLLALPLDDEHRSKREEGLTKVRNILWSVGRGGAVAIPGGLTREQFMHQALTHMTSNEQVDLFVKTPRNIPAESFEVYGVALALVTQAFVSKRPHLVKQADKLFQQLQDTKKNSETDTMNSEFDLSLERGLCTLLLGQLDECRLWLGLDAEDSPNGDPSIVEFVVANSGDGSDMDVLPGLCRLLEVWLREIVFSRFRDTHDAYVKLGDYYDDPMVLKYLESLEKEGGSPLTVAAAIARIGAEASAALGSVKMSAMQTLWKVFPLGNRERRDFADDALVDDELPLAAQSAEYSAHARNPSETTESEKDCDGSSIPVSVEMKDVMRNFVSAGALVVLLATLGTRLSSVRSRPRVTPSGTTAAMTADVISVDDSSATGMPRMNARLAEDLVKKWQNIKAQALGFQHAVDMLPEVLESQMLKLWSDRAAEIAQRGCFWEYKLLGLNIDSITISADGHRAAVEATLEEDARFTDKSHPQNNDSRVCTYTVRYEMVYTNEGWKITQGSFLQPALMSEHL